MLTPTEGSVIEDMARSASASHTVEAVRGVPEWHSLRLFGAGRHPRLVDDGAERQADR